MFDIHTHILPGVDDGARDMEMTITMIKAMHEEGVTDVIATSHYDMEDNRQDIERIKEIIKKVKEEVKEILPDINIYPGSEILYSDGIMDDIRQGKVLMLADTRCCLVEFYPDDDYAHIRNAVRNIVNEGLTPIIAHAERYRCLYKDISEVSALIKEGAYIQINTSSFEGSIFSSVRRFVMKLLKYNLIHFVGSDCHDNTHRPPKMKKCFEIIEKTVGEDAAKAITETNPKLIVSGKYL